MSLLHDATRRLFCRAGFCLLCLAPTLWTLGYCGWTRSPGHVHRAQQHLADTLGLNASLRDVVYPRPGVILYQGLELTDPDTGRGLGACRELRAQWIDGGLVLTPGQAVIHDDGLAALWRMLQQRMFRTPPGRHATIDVAPCQFVWRSRGQSQDFTLLSGYIETSGQQDTLALRLALADGSQGEPASLRLVRRRSPQGAATRLDLDTLGGNLPCTLVASTGLASWLGDDCRFNGRLRIDDVHGDWTGEITGQFTSIDLERLVEAHFPHHLSGTARLEVHQAFFKDGRLTSAAGKLVAGPGTIGPSLLDAAAKHLRMPAVEPLTQADSLAYGKLAIDVALDRRTLRIQGALPSGMVLVDRDALPLLAQPPQPQRVAHLVRCLAGPASAQVPANRQAALLLRRLP